MAKSGVTRTQFLKSLGGIMGSSKVSGSKFVLQRSELGKVFNEKELGRLKYGSEHLSHRELAALTEKALAARATPHHESHMQVIKRLKQEAAAEQADKQKITTDEALKVAQAKKSTRAQQPTIVSPRKNERAPLVSVGLAKNAEDPVISVEKLGSADQRAAIAKKYGTIKSERILREAAHGALAEHDPSSASNGGGVSKKVRDNTDEQAARSALLEEQPEATPAAPSASSPEK